MKKSISLILVFLMVFTIIPMLLPNAALAFEDDNGYVETATEIPNDCATHVFSNQNIDDITREDWFKITVPEDFIGTPILKTRMISVGEPSNYVGVDQYLYEYNKYGTFKKSDAIGINQRDILEDHTVADSTNMWIVEPGKTYYIKLSKGLNSVIHEYTLTAQLDVANKVSWPTGKQETLTPKDDIGGIVYEVTIPNDVPKDSTMQRWFKTENIRNSIYVIPKELPDNFRKDIAYIPGSTESIYGLNSETVVNPGDVFYYFYFVGGKEENQTVIQLKTIIPGYTAHLKVLSSITIGDLPKKIKVGDKASLSLFANYDDGTKEPISPCQAEWTVSNTFFAQINGNVLVGKKEGSVSLKVKYEGKTASTEITIVKSIDGTESDDEANVSNDNNSSSNDDWIEALGDLDDTSVILLKAIIDALDGKVKVDAKNHQVIIIIDTEKK